MKSLNKGNSPVIVDCKAGILARSYWFPLRLSTLRCLIWLCLKALSHLSRSAESLLLLRSSRLRDLRPANSFNDADGSQFVPRNSSFSL